MLTFLSPLFLIGVLSAAIPLLIHLSRSRRTKVVVFSSTRFLTDRFLRSYRMSRVTEVVLLACRMALCAVLAMALARPIWAPKGRAALPGGTRAVVFVIDDSASMGYVENGRSLLDRARTSAREILDTLRRGDSASIVLGARRDAGPEALFPQVTPELGDVAHALETIRPRTLGTDLTAAVAKARAVARGASASSKEIYVFSDLQTAGLPLPAERESSGDVSVAVVRVRPRKVANLGVTAVQYEAARPIVGVPYSIRPHVVSVGDGPPDAAVRLYVDDRKVAEMRLERLRDGRWAAPRFHHVFASGGRHSGYVEVDDPNLELDNRRYFAVDVLDSVRVLAVDGAPSNVPQRDELFFLKAALTAAPEGRGPIAVDVVGPANLVVPDPGKHPLVILANVASLPGPAVEALEAYVDRGGSLLVFAGDRCDPRAYDASLSARTRIHGGLLPGRLLGREGSPDSDRDAATIGRIAADHPALAAFAEPGFAELSSVRLKAYWRVEPANGAAVLMRSDGGAPLVCEKAFGKGRVMLVAWPGDRDWSDFPVRPAFLPWIHRTVGYLAQSPAARESFRTTGEPIPLPVSAAEGSGRILVRTPDGKLAPPQATDDPDRPLAFTATEVAGVYAIVSPKAPVAEGLIAVNLEGRESDLTYLDDGVRAKGADRAEAVERELAAVMPGTASLAYIDDPAHAVDATRVARQGIRLWDVGLWIALLVALFEPWLANRISMKLYGRPREIALTGTDETTAPPVDREGTIREELREAGVS